MSRVTRETWAKRVERWQDSGLTIAEFAREAGLNARSLSWWRWQLTTKASEEPAVKASETLAVKPGEQPAAPRRRRARASKPSLTFVEVAAPAARREPLEVVLGGGRCIRVPVDFDATALERLLAVLERRQ
jgi:transposase-like protein